MLCDTLMMEVLFATCAFLFGLIVGSFVNVLTLRFGFRESSRPRSQCEACGARLSWFDLVPLLSSILLHGRCRACGSRIAPQYLLVELATGFLFLSVFLGSPLSLQPAFLFAMVAHLVFWAVFVGIVSYDLRHTLIPLPFTLALIGAAVAVRVGEAFSVLSIAPVTDALLGAAALGGFLALVVLVTRGKGMGTGDIHIAAALGLLFGFWRGIEVMMLAFWIGALVGVVLLAFGKGFRMKSEVPFAPFLLIAAAFGAFTAVSPFSSFSWILAL